MSKRKQPCLGQVGLTKQLKTTIISDDENSAGAPSVFGNVSLPASQLASLASSDAVTPPAAANPSLPSTWRYTACQIFSPKIKCLDVQYAS